MRVYQFRHFGSSGKVVKESEPYCFAASHFFPGDFSGVAFAVSDADGSGEGEGCAVAVGKGDGCGVCSGIPDCSTERVPLIAGSESSNAISMKAAAAPIVIFASSVCVPRGPNAVLETELEKSAPASAFPGCNSIVTTKMTHARINSPSKT